MYIVVFSGGGPRPERLMEAQVDVLTDEECRYYLYNLDNLYTPEWHVCVYDPEGEGATDPVGLCNGLWWIYSFWWNLGSSHIKGPRWPSG